MASTGKGRFLRRCRVYFRRFRITVWVILLLLTGILVYLNQIGLPDFVKKPLLKKLQARGLDVQFTRLRLSWHNGIEANNVQFGQPSRPEAPRITAAEATVRPNLRALTRFQLQLDSIGVRKGKLVWKFGPEDSPRDELTVENIQTDLRFLPADQWSLDNFRADFAGARIRLAGNITNASALRTWKIFQGHAPTPPAAWQRRLRRVAEALRDTKFSETPELRLDVRGDALDPRTFTCLLMLSAPGAQTPWGDLSGCKLMARVHAASNTLSRATLQLDAQRANTKWASSSALHLRADVSADDSESIFKQLETTLTAETAKTRWAEGRNVRLKLNMFSLNDQTNAYTSQVDLEYERADSKWARTGKSHLTARWLQSSTNAVPLSGTSTLRSDWAETKWASAKGVLLNVNLRSATNNSGAFPRSTWAWWTNIVPYQLQWDAHFEQLARTNTQASSVFIAGQWLAPDLEVTNVEAIIQEGRLSAKARLNVDSRRLQANIVSEVNPGNVEELLTIGARRWLGQFTWNSAPFARGALSLILPAWTNRAPDWRAEVRPTLVLDGEFDVRGGGSYRGLQAQAASSHFNYSNMCWHLPDLMVSRPEGTFAAEHWADDRTKDFHWHLRSTIDPREAAPLLGTNANKVRTFATFTQPPLIEGEVWGKSHEPSRTAFTGSVTVSNFTFRGESFSHLQTGVDYTNKLLLFRSPRAQRGHGNLNADGVLADFERQLVFITNGFSTVEPLAVARAIGPKVGHALEPYRFEAPPTVHVSGTAPMHGEEAADLRFLVEGGPFHWLHFDVPTISGTVQWRGLNLSLTKVRLDLYGGDASGYALINFKTNKQPAEYEFAVTTTNTSLKALMAGVFTATNKLEGLLSGSLVVTHGTANDWRQWDGYGSLRLRDGLIWDIPIFGVFSPVLNGIAPGLGNSRANSGQCTFTLTNGVLHSDNLEVHCSGMRMLYRGNVDLTANVNARVEAELLRDMWIFGPLVSTVFWPVTKMFEYRVTGTLGHPELDSVYFVPKLIQLPFQPFRILRGLLPGDSNANRTNAPPERTAK